MTVQENRRASFGWETAYLDALEKEGLNIEPEQPHGARRPDFSVHDADGKRQFFLEIKGHVPDQGEIIFSSDEMLQIKDQMTIAVKEAQQKALVLAMREEFLCTDQRQDLQEHASNSDCRLFIVDINEIERNIDLMNKIMEGNASDVPRESAEEFAAATGRAGDYSMGATEEKDLLTDPTTGTHVEGAQAGVDGGLVGSTGRNLEDRPNQAGELAVENLQDDAGRKWEAEIPAASGSAGDIGQGLTIDDGVTTDAWNEPAAARDGADVASAADLSLELAVDTEQGDEGRRWEASIPEVDDVETASAVDGTKADVGPEASASVMSIDPSPVFGPLPAD
jgi:hypothetical protein